MVILASNLQKFLQKPLLQFVAPIYLIPEKYNLCSKQVQRNKILLLLYAVTVYIRLRPYPFENPKRWQSKIHSKFCFQMVLT